LYHELCSLKNTVEHLYEALPIWASRHRSIMHSSILLMIKRVYQVDIILVVLGSLSYLILIQQDHLGVINIYAIIIGTPLVHCESCFWFVQF